MSRIARPVAVWLLALAFCLCLFGSTALASQADVEYIPSDQYFDVVMREIQNAQASIHVTMFLVTIFPGNTNSKSYKLLDTLIQAKQRGVDVHVVLDQNADWVDNSPQSWHAPWAKNRFAYEALAQHGVHVRFDDVARYTHAKVIVLDNKKIILGSTNWTHAALELNVEASVLVTSESLAQEILADLEKIKLEEPDFLAVSMTRMTWEFLYRQDLMGRMVNDGAERTLDVYFCLLKIHGSQKAPGFTLDYEQLAQLLGIAHWSRTLYRQRINVHLRMLQNGYKLIDVTRPKKKYTLVRLRDQKSPGKPYETPTTDFISIPATYWDYGWSTRLTFPGKIVYLLNLLYRAKSNNAARWFRSVQDMAEAHHISERFISAGNTQLRRHNLLEVKPGSLGVHKNGKRDANEYTPNPLYDPEDLNKKIKKLQEQRGKEKVQRAMTRAAAVYEDSDYNGIVQLIVLEDEFGQALVEEAIAYVGGLDSSNPRRTMGYLINTIKGMGKNTPLPHPPQ